ncbi:MAG: prepilin peptidase, partial [Patescibacteria group bacterium]|nr:prepilin peptidase [Patescibacteria group bacterium]
MYLFLFASFVLGTILGSFINALVFRFNTGRGMGGRSRCMHCGHTLSALDLIPVLSFLFLRGQCRYCGARISWQYPLVELAAGALALLVYIQIIEATPLWEGIALYIFWLTVWMTLLFIVVYDIRHGIIPWSVSGFLIVLSLVYLFFFTEATLWNLLAGPLLALPLFLFSLVSRGTWMGWGDSALELSLGWLLGLTMGLTALVLAFWAGAIVGIALIIAKKGFKMKSELPFAPFLVLGALATHFFYVDFFAT